MIDKVFLYLHYCERSYKCSQQEED